MNKLRPVAVAVVGTVVAVAAAYAVFAGVLVGSDVASYTSDGVTVPDLAYEDTLERADAAGYAVERVGSSGFHPTGIDDLDADLGPEYEAFRVTYDHASAARLWATFHAEEGITVVTLFPDDADGDLTVDDLPPEEWLVDRLALLFEMDEATAAAYVEEIETAVSTGDPTEPGASTPSVEVDEPVAFRAAYDDLTARATTVNATSTPGSGWHERVYHAGDERLGSAEFVLSRATVTREVDGYTYRVHVDYHGGVAVDAQTRATRTFEEDAVRAAFREMFVEMGVPPETADHLQFLYRGSVW
ncbi:hypothetical protein PN419_03965 [Halorubrum ezzemoulense]|uniref:DUF4825 domain-containing protein n=1 Tax=Halorubrum ezzemoulense TaxID=337243 RepID=A0ABT4Z4M0_HALEZ|nr:MULTISPECIES: hypothetical protein [Halorubrum]MDB2244652.1 hypothetical protein [Halorubrum ezzemoulense]MDB2250859.1 hypothetical protein [Halorubrum ezzemoulense]MDB2278591.1 hypothetical protein [Halorubrum ezzemoulense]MDB2285265.1 hypothetical protein [Halorubrum ezzemoulense]MDB2287986.1 hypothetical protein [Halorubrum ezzemoulense]